jgi:DNA polymerase-3 subunit epsilon
MTRQGVQRNGPNFAAIDFETADAKRDSACAIGIVVVRAQKVAVRYQSLIRPPRKAFSPFCVGVHGITWDMVRNERPFADVWAEAAALLPGLDFLVAHNAPFDNSVLKACCQAADIEPPALPFHCTVRASRELWGQPHNRLPDVCRLLDIPLTNHHDALADAEACAQIAISAIRAGWTP